MKNEAKGSLGDRVRAYVAYNFGNHEGAFLMLKHDILRHIIINFTVAALSEQIEETLDSERERILAKLEAKLIKSSLPDAYEEGFDDGLWAAIEIVKGGEK